MIDDIPSSRTVMIVEDNTDLCLLLSTILKIQGIKTTTACGGEEAWAKLQSGDLPDLIVTDLRMPGMNGAVFIDKLQHDARTRDIPVILSTAHPEIFSQAQQMGVQGYLAKPYSMANVISLMNTFMPALDSTPIATTPAHL